MEMSTRAGRYQPIACLRGCKETGQPLAGLLGLLLAAGPFGGSLAESTACGPQQACAPCLALGRRALLLVCLPARFSHAGTRLGLAFAPEAVLALLSSTIALRQIRRPCKDSLKSPAAPKNARSRILPSLSEEGTQAGW